MLSGEVEAGIKNRFVRIISRAGVVGLVSLVVFAVSSASVVMHPQPVNAEGFLTKTVRCLTGLLLLRDCSGDPLVQSPREAPASPSTAAPSPTPTQSPAPTQPSQDRTTIPPGPASTSGAANTPASIEIAPLPVAVPQTVAPTPPALPKPAHRQVFAYEPQAYLAFMYPHSSGIGVLGDPSRPVRASHDGWYIWGVLWYWWLVGFGLFAIAVKHALRSIKKANLLKT